MLAVCVEESDNEDNYDSSDDEHELDMEKFLALCNEEDDQTDDNTDDDPEYRVDEESEIDSDGNYRQQITFFFMVYKNVI